MERHLAVASATSIKNGIDTLRQSVNFVKDQAKNLLASLDKLVDSGLEQAVIGSENPTSWCAEIVQAQQRLMDVSAIDEILFPQRDNTVVPTARQGVEQLRQQSKALFCKVLTALERQVKQESSNLLAVLTCLDAIVGLSPLCQDAQAWVERAFLGLADVAKVVLSTNADNVDSAALEEKTALVTSYLHLIGDLIAKSESVTTLRKLASTVPATLEEVFQALAAWRVAAIETTKVRLNAMQKTADEALARRDIGKVKVALDNMRWLQKMDPNVDGLASATYSQAADRVRSELERALRLAETAVQKNDAAQMAENRSFLDAARQQGLKEHLRSVPLE